MVTTASGAERLGGAARGLVDWEGTRLEAPGKPTLEIIATPCRHGPPLSRPLVGDVIGFVVIVDRRVLWISGDTVLYDGVRSIAGRFDIDVALIHLGGVRFPVTGPLRYTMTARDAVELVGLLEPRVAVPIHYEGWKHFQQERAAIEHELAAEPRFRWIEIGAPAEFPADPQDHARPSAP